jgi:hypothetical protein
LIAVGEAKVESSGKSDKSGRAIRVEEWKRGRAEERKSGRVEERKEWKSGSNREKKANESKLKSPVL